MANDGNNIEIDAAVGRVIMIKMIMWIQVIYRDLYMKMTTFSGSQFGLNSQTYFQRVRRTEHNTAGNPTTVLVSGKQICSGQDARAVPKS